MGKNRLAELQANSKHIKKSDLEQDEDQVEMQPLKKKDKAMTSSQNDFFDKLSEISMSIDTVRHHDACQVGLDLNFFDHLTDSKKCR